MYVEEHGLLLPTFLTFVNKQGLGIITSSKILLMLFSYRITDHLIWSFCLTGKEIEAQKGASSNSGKKKYLLLSLICTLMDIKNGKINLRIDILIPSIINHSIKCTNYNN